MLTAFLAFDCSPAKVTAERANSPDELFHRIFQGSGKHFNYDGILRAAAAHVQGRYKTCFGPGPLAQLQEYPALVKVLVAGGGTIVHNVQRAVWKANSRLTHVRFVLSIEDYL